MAKIGKYITRFGLAIAAIGLIVGVSPWTFSIYVWMYPEQSRLEGLLDGGPYPELPFLFLVLPLGLIIALAGFAISKFVAFQRRQIQ
jgi:hypothetical protein